MDKFEKKYEQNCPTEFYCVFTTLYTFLLFFQYVHTCSHISAVLCHTNISFYVSFLLFLDVFEGQRRLETVREG